MKKQTLLKIFLPIFALGVGVLLMSGIKATGQEEAEKEEVDVRPTVTVKLARAEDYQVILSSFGEVKSVEDTMLSAQVSGEVTHWNENFVAGGLVRRGEVLFSIDKIRYESAVLQAEADVSVAEASLIEERARGEVAKREAKTLPAAKVTDLYLRKPQLLSAEANLKSAQARLKLAQRDLEFCDVKAPYDALVISRTIGVGQFVNQGAQVAQISNIEAAEVVFPVAGFDNAFLPNELKGNAASLISRGNQTFAREAKISRDLGVVDRSTRMGQLVVQVEDPYSLKTQAPKMPFGTYVEVEFIGQVLSNVYKLPQEWVNNDTVWVVGNDKKLIPKKVTVVREEGPFFLVSAGLAENDQLVTTLPEYPQEGMEVKIDGEPDDFETPAKLSILADNN
ncbi:efflux RND transporter periplasmic adaptor subunit [Alteromonadaceae bacterium M269]|nr:efflux RND transporter periplasmic adaptor subunit [Alteromonadaceae bacterium M269]